jgi:hypothetical protein
MFYIGDFMTTAIYDFEKASEKTEIINPMQYMKSCIWNAMQAGDISGHASFNYHMKKYEI